MTREESTGARAARAERTEAAMADLGSLLTASFGYEETLRGLATFAVRSIADICIVDVIENDVVRRVHVATSNPEQAALATELHRFPLDRSRPHLSLEALASGHPQIVRDITPELLETSCQGNEHREILERLGPRSFMAVPLSARHQLLGVVLFLSCGAPYDDEDLTLADRLVRLAALQVDNARLYREAQEALLARDRVLGIVAHDLRNPLNVISMSAELLAGGGLTEGQQAAQVQMISRSASRMNRLIQDLLDVARIEAGRLNLQREAQDASQLVHDAVELNSALARAKSLELTATVGDRIPQVSVDRDRMLQVLSNLLGNTIKFTPAGGRIDVSLRREGDEAVFAVSDTGPGIAPEDLANLFQPFWQAQRSSSEGAGLGLSIARGIVEAHGGRIGADSCPGKGSTFHFAVPLEAAAPAQERRRGVADRRGTRRGSPAGRASQEGRTAATSRARH